MTTTQLYALLPFFTLTSVICVLLIAIAFWRNVTATCIVSSVGLVLTFLSIMAAYRVAPIVVTPLIRVDGYGMMFSGLIVLASLSVSLLSYDYFRHRNLLHDEFYVLMLCSTLGGMTLACATHFASFVLGLELLSVSIYAMISYPPRGLFSVEAALKYLILSGVSSAFILFGIALLFSATGVLSFEAIANFDYQDEGNSRLLLLVSVAMILAGFMFKLSLVPFHMWTPDVYEGAPAPVTAFVATLSKGAVFAVLLRLFVLTDLYQYEPVITGLSIVAILSMIGGNLLALLQDNIKRVLAYSSIAHLGYLMIAFIAGGIVGGKALAIEAASWFLIAYFVTTLGAFGVVTIMSGPNHERDVDTMADYEGLFWRRPALATAFSAMLLSLAGIPLTAGFIGKFYLFAAGVESKLWLLISILIIGSGIGLFYYLRIIFNMTRRTDEHKAPVGIPITGGWVMVSLTLTLFILGVYPTPVINLINGLLG